MLEKEFGKEYAENMLHSARALCSWHAHGSTATPQCLYSNYEIRHHRAHAQIAKVKITCMQV